MLRDVRDTNGGLFRIGFSYSLQTSPIENLILVSMELGGNNAYCLTFQRLPRILMEHLEIRNTIPHASENLMTVATRNIWSFDSYCLNVVHCHVQFSTE
jgi:hypothetical protein